MGLIDSEFYDRLLIIGQSEEVINQMIECIKSRVDFVMGQSGNRVTPNTYLIEDFSRFEIGINDFLKRVQFQNLEDGIICYDSVYKPGYFETRALKSTCYIKIRGGIQSKALDWDISTIAITDTVQWLNAIDFGFWGKETQVLDNLQLTGVKGTIRKLTPKEQKLFLYLGLAIGSLLLIFIGLGLGGNIGSIICYLLAVAGGIICCREKKAKVIGIIIIILACVMLLGSLLIGMVNVAIRKVII